MDLAFLNPVLNEAGPWASVYMAGAAPGPGAESQQELTAREARSRLSSQGADDATCEAVFATLREPWPEHPGLAVFAKEGEVRLTVPLREPPPLPETQWTPVPHLTPLMERIAEPHTCLVAYIDKQGADFELRRAGGVGESAGGVTGRDWPLTRTPTVDWSERRFQLSVENTWEQNAAEIAAGVAQTAEETGANVVLLVGDPRQRRSVHDKLPTALNASVVETRHGGRAEGSQSRLLDEEIEELIADQRHRDNAEALERFRRGRAERNGGVTAVEGVPALVEAAREHRVATLLLRPGGSDLQREVWIGQNPDQVAVRRTDARYLGEPEPSSARADDALLRSVAATGGDVVVLTEDEAGTEDVPVGGLGAVLRWAEESGGDSPGGSAEAA
ncbi:hypothetical protein GL263_10285 [Streptomyces durbertensis]|uniref:Peptide chain release factor 1 n=1 Tax=Streptomyces durbertensis TaxID=2448886 RepID=A0ABR6EF38_9ACTN|nr:Vms1/Ankzf1 family peptidyl-tRNA hydrolase [Streptomyces durbertensis]MBB1243941.1 hypothetical protein [Streptomyces durbertensis]